MNYRGGRSGTRNLAFARNLRENATDAERTMWSMLRGRACLGLKFRRQHEFGPYILDYFCDEIALAIELDGPHHLTPEFAGRDSKRTEYLQQRGITVVRIENEELDLNAPMTMQRIVRTAEVLMRARGMDPEGRIRQRS